MIRLKNKTIKHKIIQNYFVTHSKTTVALVKNKNLLISNLYNYYKMDFVNLNLKKFMQYVYDLHKVRLFLRLYNNIVAIFGVRVEKSQ